jgi:hypothetical protein
MKGAILLMLAALVLPVGARAEDALTGNTLICQSYKDVYNHGAVPERIDWRSVRHVYITATNMFTQNAMKEIKTNTVHGGDAKAMGQVYEWDKRKSGQAGLRASYRSYASRSVEKISFELEYTVKNTLADDVTMNVAEKGEIFREGGEWRIFSEAKQSLTNGRRPAIYNTQSWFRCELKEGRHLL